MIDVFLIANKRKDDFRLEMDKNLSGIKSGTFQYGKLNCK